MVVPPFSIFPTRLELKLDSNLNFNLKLALQASQKEKRREEKRRIPLSARRFFSTARTQWLQTAVPKLPSVSAR